MIKSFANKGTEDIFNGDNTRYARATLPTNLWDAAAVLLDQLNAAAQLSDMMLPKSNRLEALRGDRQGSYSVRINKQYRICFTFENGDADRVEITDYH